MTLILAWNGSLAGDRRVTAESGEKCENLRKIVANEWLIAGFAGDFETILESIRLVEAGESDPKVIARTGVEGLIIKDGRTLLLDCRKVWKRPKKEAFYCCGSGSAEAMAFLSGRLSAKKSAKLVETDIKLTFRYVAKCRIDCSSTYDTLSG